ncbi:MAG: MarR family transcriptional regulator [Pseudonocardiaceae bacterium]|nr:MarR family transcriptional regulator [Pseudonocardiaceae bacterium]
MTITDAKRVLQIVGDLDRLLVDVRDPVLRDADLTREHWQVLRLLADGQGHPMGEISAGLGLAGATATRTVDALAQRTLAYRHPDPLDRRRVLIYLGEPGQQLLEQVDAAILDQATTLLDGLNPRERAELVRLLERLATASNAQSE